MSLRKTIGLIKPGSVVGTVYDRGSLKAALALAPGAVDWVELRVDAFAGAERSLGELEKAARDLDFPKIVTVRHPAEGGASQLSLTGRRELLKRFLPFAALVDVELRSAASMKALLDAAREAGCGVILSFHDFAATPSLFGLRRLAGRAAAAGADIFKVAATPKDAAGFATLLQFLAEKKSRKTAGLRLAVMGMGPYGKVSRLALGGAGSVLNYGYLHRVQVPGQWPARLLKERLAELSPAGQ